MCNLSIQSVMNFRLKLFDNNSYSQILVTVEYLSGIDIVNLERPPVDLNDLVSEITELERAEILPEVIDALLCKHRLDEVVTVTHQDLGNYFDDKQLDGFVSDEFKLFIVFG